MHKMKRAVSLLLACCLLLGGIVHRAPRASAYMDTLPLPGMTGDIGQDVANIAISQLGYHEVNGGTAYGAWWSGVTGWGDYTKLGWCSMFACWCAYQAGAGMDIAYSKYSAVVGNNYNFLKNNGTVDRSFTTTPMPGDFIFFGRGDSFEHVAVVTGYNASTNKVTFVGGNQGDAVTQGTVVWSGSTKWGSQYVLGYGRPNYGGKVEEPECTCDSYYAGYYRVTTNNSALNIRNGHGTWATKIGSIPNGTAVYVSKAQGPDDSDWAHVEYNDLSGYASMQYLKRMDDHVLCVNHADNGDIIDAEVTVFDYVEAAGYGLKLPEPIPASKTLADAIPIRVSIPDSFLLDLTVEMEKEGSGCVFYAQYPDGTAGVLENTVVEARNISVAMEGEAVLYILDQSTGFPDVTPGDRFKNAIDYVSSRGIMKGKEDGTFAPNEIVNRQMVAMVLWNMAGQPETSQTSPFPDVTGGRFYPAIVWAYSCKIISGYQDGTFRPTQPITREHFASMLHKFAMQQGYLLPAVTDKKLSDFPDYAQINVSRFGDACQWAVSCGFISGKADGRFDPKSGTTRAQLAMILYRFLQAVNDSENLE